MKLEQLLFTEADGWTESGGSSAPNAQLVVAFGGRHQLAERHWHDDLAVRFPAASGDRSKPASRGRVKTGQSIQDGSVYRVIG